MAIISFSEIKSKLNTLSQEMLSILLSYIKENPTPIASANTFTPFHSVISSGNLTQGRYYEILTNTGSDFTGVGAANNTVGTQFKANSTSLTPTWGTGTLAEAAWNGNTITVSGTTTINTISKKFLNYGDRIRLIFEDALQLTDSIGTTGDDCELVLGSNLTTVSDDEIELQLRSDDKFYVIGGNITGLKGVSLWNRVAGFTKLKVSEQIQLSKLFQTKQAAAIPTANNVTPPADGNYVNFSDNSIEVQRIGNIDSDAKNIQGGTFYIFDVKEGTTIKHLIGNSGDNKQIRVDSGQDWTAGKDTPVIAFYDSEDDWWELSGTATGDTLNDILNIFATPENGAAYNMTSGGELVGWEVNDLSGYSVTNQGTATVSINSNSDGIDIGTGTIYGIEIQDGSSNVVHFFGCNENKADKLFLIDSITGDYYLISGAKTAITQDNLFEAQNNGVTFREDDDNAGTFIQINYTDSKVKTEIG